METTKKENSWTKQKKDKKENNNKPKEKKAKKKKTEKNPAELGMAQSLVKNSDEASSH